MSNATLKRDEKENFKRKPPLIKTTSTTNSSVVVFYKAVDQPMSMSSYN